MRFLFCPSAPSFTRLEEGAERPYPVWFFADCNHIDSASGEFGGQAVLDLSGLFAVKGACVRIRRVDRMNAASFGVAETDPAYGRQFCFEWISRPDGDDIVASCCLSESGKSVNVLLLVKEEVGEKEGDAAASFNCIEFIQGAAQPCAWDGCLFQQDIVDEASEDVGPGLWWCVANGVACEQQEPDLIVVTECGVADDGGDLGGQTPFGLLGGTEGLGCADVDHEHDPELTFLAVSLDEWRSLAGRDVPVDCTDIVAGDVASDLFELHPRALESGVVGPRQAFCAVAPRKDLQFPCFS